MATPVFGHVGTAQPGDLFASRAELAQRGQHRPLQAGICATQELGAESIVLSDKYEDDEVHDDFLLYTGHGGRSEESGQQVANQTLTKANKGLARSQVTGRPVRVFRKVTAEGGAQAFRYEGLFWVVSRDYRPGRSGFLVFLFRLEPLVTEAAAPPAPKLYAPADLAAPPAAAEPAPRYEATVSRLIRDTSITRQVKDLHNSRCQVCGERLATPAGFYAEAAHIRPLGAPHHGPDTLRNVLCLCPNHHALFDFGSFGIADDYSLLGLPGQLRRHAAHQPDPAHLAYHRQHIYRPLAPAAP
ncbi:MAG: HNH endonuclease [Hymenobacter sp.]|nr:MAG: HNH endonuclease [Hymenobacter sp.]